MLACEETDFCLDLHLGLYTDFQILLSLSSKYAQRDLFYISRRARSEGVSFFTKTLPALGDWLLASLEAGYSINIPTAFSKCRNAVAPRLFRGFTRNIFSKDGTLIENERTVLSVRAVLNLSLIFSKLSTSKQNEEEHIRACFSQFVELENAASKINEQNDSSFERILNTTRNFINDLFSESNTEADMVRNSRVAGRCPSYLHHLLVCGKAFPGFGPGATHPASRPHERVKSIEESGNLDYIYPGDMLFTTDPVMFDHGIFDPFLVRNNILLDGLKHSDGPTSYPPTAYVNKFGRFLRHRRSVEQSR
jgi:hypothetical protein